MSTDAAANCEQLRQNFEGRECILIEKGAVRVRVSDIEARLDERFVKARIQSIPSRGLPAGSLHYHAAYRAGHPFQIGGGFHTWFSDHVWKMGYGGWTLYFAPDLVKGVVELAAQWPDGLDPFERYDRIARWLLDHRVDEGPGRLVFPA